MGIKVSATSYNAIQTKVAGVLGTGSGDSGYGNAVSSSQVTSSISIKSAPWVNLRNDLLKARQFQTGLDETGKIAPTGVGAKIKDGIYQGAVTMANDIVANRLVSPPDNQVAVQNLVSPQVRTAPWNGQITQTVTVNFASADSMRWFFNANSTIRISASIVNYSGTGVGQKGQTWDAMLSGMGTISFGRSSTACSGSGNNSAIGYLQLTSSDQLIFQKTAPSGTYSDNDYLIYARAPSSTQIVFTIAFRDNATYTNTTIYPGGYGPYGVDENVDGTLTSNVQMRFGNGPNVYIAYPTASTTAL